MPPPSTHRRRTSASLLPALLHCRGGAIIQWHPEGPADTHSHCKNISSNQLWGTSLASFYFICIPGWYCYLSLPIFLSQWRMSLWSPRRTFLSLLMSAEQATIAVAPIFQHGKFYLFISHSSPMPCHMRPNCGTAHLFMHHLSSYCCGGMWCKPPLLLEHFSSLLSFPYQPHWVFSAFVGRDYHALSSSPPPHHLWHQTTVHSNEFRMTLFPLIGQPWAPSSFRATTTTTTFQRL